ncbi:uncharacterized protein B0H18DRAFT_547876 [Fomitopsis serialis]|uniref:uncharacterized protein n=1 Tax=Fomitopsis serialis TaxID=139415 RepID=UPI002007F6C1|nr:uncharacterized protein B0H18DRAFT_547876 [Neoantrodia serialis]KAH9934221.1 hypothetical protein B0H18DRAFT_547876 [Neoantrodia serialis]
MFQVASRPVPELSLPMSHSYGHPNAPQNLQLPRTLSRPAFTEVSRSAIATLEPELANVPIEFVRKHLAGQANEMLSALSLLTYPTSLPKAHLPPTLDVPVRPTASSPPRAFPTHMLAVSSSRGSPSQPNTPTAASFLASNSPTSTVPLFPAHALVLAAYCPLLPQLPRSTGQRGNAAVSLPLVPLAVPSAETFHLLHAYLHTRRPDTLLAALLPSLASSLPPAHGASSSSSHQRAYVSNFSNESLLRLAHALASGAAAHAGPQGALGGLMAHVKVINGLWRNVCALGVSDAELWGVMDVAWEVVLAALTRVAERERA